MRRANGRVAGKPRVLRDIGKAFRRPHGRPLPVRLPDRNGGFPRLSDGPSFRTAAHGFRCPASLRHARARRKPWETVSMGHYQRSLVLCPASSIMTLDEMPLWASLVIKPHRLLWHLRIDGDAVGAVVAPPGAFSAWAPARRRNNRRSRGPICGPASRPRRTSPARDRAGTWNRPGPRRARA